MNERELRELNSKIDKLEKESKTLGWSDAERELYGVLTPLLKADGYSIQASPRSQDTGFDYVGDKTTEENRRFRLGIQYKHRLRTLIRLDEIAPFIVRAQLNGIDRAILVTNGGSATMR